MALACFGLTEGVAISSGIRRLREVQDRRRVYQQCHVRCVESFVFSMKLGCRIVANHRRALTFHFQVILERGLHLGLRDPQFFQTLSTCS